MGRDTVPLTPEQQKLVDDPSPRMQPGQQFGQGQVPGQEMVQTLSISQQNLPEQTEQNYLSRIAIGSKRLLRLLFKLPIASDGIITAAGIISIAAGTHEILVETLEQSQASFYVWDIICLDDAVVDVFITAGINSSAVAGGGVQCALLKRRVTGNPDSINVILLIDNAISGTTTLAYKVYRIAGLG